MRFRVALALGETSDPRAATALARIVVAMPRTAGSGPRCSARALRWPTGCSSISGRTRARSEPETRRIRAELLEAAGRRSSARGTGPMRSAASSIVLAADAGAGCLAAARSARPLGPCTGSRLTALGRSAPGRSRSGDGPGRPGRASGPAGQDKSPSTPGRPNRRVWMRSTVLSCDRPGRVACRPAGAARAAAAAGRAGRRGAGAGRGPIGQSPRRLAAPAARVRAVGPRGRGPDALEPRELDQSLASGHPAQRSSGRDQPGAHRAGRSRTALEAPRCRDRPAGASHSSARRHRAPAPR